MALEGTCFEATVDEKALKGGSSNMIVREYVFVLCPFHNITQTEPNHQSWTRAQDKARLGDLYVAGDFSEPDEQAPILLGVFDSWKEEQHQMVFEHGEVCGTGTPRRAIVQIDCGLVNEVVSVKENELCVYTLRFQTPAACHTHPRSTHDEL